MSKIMISMLKTNEYKKGRVNVACGSSAATIFIYVAAPVIIHISNWKCVFVFSAVCTVLMCAMWIVGFGKVKKHLQYTDSINTETYEAKEKFTPSVYLLLLVILVSIIIQGSLRDGVANWMPSYISEMFNFGSEISILTSVALPICSIFTYHAVAVLNRKYIQNEYVCVALMYIIGAVCAFLLSVAGNSSAVVAIVAAALLNAVMHGINYCQTTLTPIYFVRYGKVSFIAGILNSGTYLGSALSTYGVAALTKSFSWEGIAMLWCVMAAIGAVVSFIIVRAWGNFKK